MSYVSTTSFSILISGELANLLSASRGLRKGDPPISLLVYYHG